MKQPPTFVAADGIDHPTGGVPPDSPGFIPAFVSPDHPRCAALTAPAGARPPAIGPVWGHPNVQKQQKDPDEPDQGCDHAAVVLTAGVVVAIGIVMGLSSWALR